VPDRLQGEKVDDLLDQLPVADLLAARRAEPEERGHEREAHARVAAEHEVLEDGEVAEELDVLE
jgi:uncharacterized protein (DUF2267 family)